MDANACVIPAEIRLKRYLHYGSESALCLPGDQKLQCFLLDKLTAVESMLAECAPDKQGDAVNHIMKAFMDGYSGHTECLVFALAVCASQRSSEILRSQAYSAVKTVCKTPQDLFLFTTFTKKLSPLSKGYGSGWRKAVCEWYLSKDPEEMADCVTLVRGDYGITHRDLLKLSHIKTNDAAKKTILCYVMKGLEAAKMQSDKENDTVQRILLHLQYVEEAKHQTDPHACARLIELHDLKMGVVPHNLLNSSEVWIALLPRLPLGKLLDNIIRLSCNGLLTNNRLLVDHIVDRLLDQTAIVESKLHPTVVFCALKRYENHAINTHEFMGKLIKQGKVDKQLKPPPKPNTQIIDALNKLLISTFKLLVPTGMRYLLAIDLSSNMKTWKCSGARDVKPAQAATLLALCLLHAEREVTVLGFPPVLGAPPEEDLIDPLNPILHATSNRNNPKKAGGGVIYPRKQELQPMVPLTLDKELSVVENLEKMCDAVTGPVEVCQPMVWAMQNKKPVDVFIVLTDYVTKRKREFMEPSSALIEYRENMKMPHAKLVTCALSSNTLDVAASYDVGMFDVVGFDGKVARIIEAFSRGAF